MDCIYSNRCSHKHCDKNENCMIKFKLDYLYKEAGLSDKQRTYIDLKIDADGTDLNEFKKLSEIQEHIVEFVDQGEQLFIHSPQSGNGKTSWALRLMQCYFKRIWLKTSLKCRGLFVSVPSYLLAMKSNISQTNEYYNHIKDNILEADIVIFDDIAAKSGSEYEINNLLSIIDARISNGKCNIFTSNLDDTEMQAALGSRLASRICNSSINIILKGGDKRGI